MSYFATPPLKVSPHPTKKNTWVLDEKLVYVVGPADSPIDIIEVPEGFESDLASIPWVFHWFLPKRGRYDAPAKLHDWCYGQRYVSQSYSDWLFLDAMNAKRVKPWRKWLMYWVVILTGGYFWNRPKKEGV